MVKKIIIIIIQKHIEKYNYYFLHKSSNRLKNICDCCTTSTIEMRRILQAPYIGYKEVTIFMMFSYSSFCRPTYLGLGTSITRTFSSFPFTMCMN